MLLHMLQQMTKGPWSSAQRIEPLRAFYLRLKAPALAVVSSCQVNQNSCRNAHFEAFRHLLAM